ncbi:hypothetical protein Tco_0632433 [Tanacetum coccineum]
MPYKQFQQTRSFKHFNKHLASNFKRGIMTSDVNDGENGGAWAIGDVSMVAVLVVVEFEKSNDEEAVVLSASRAASIVVDAANATILSSLLKCIMADYRKHSGSVDESANLKDPKPEANEEVEEFFILNSKSLANLIMYPVS